MMQPDSKLGEYERIVDLVARKSELLCAVARRGHAEHGRGAVFYCEEWAETIPQATPFYMAASEPEFAMAGADINRAAAVYRPSSEAVVVVVTKQGEVYLVRLRLPSIKEEAFRSRMH